LELVTKEERETLATIVKDFSIINKLADEIADVIADELHLDKRDKELIRLLIKIIILFILKMRKDYGNKSSNNKS